jgi:hypothetical protein
MGNAGGLRYSPRHAVLEISIRLHTVGVSIERRNASWSSDTIVISRYSAVADGTLETVLRSHRSGASDISTLLLPLLLRPNRQWLVLASRVLISSLV